MAYLGVLATSNCSNWSESRDSQLISRMLIVETLWPAGMMSKEKGGKHPEGWSRHSSVEVRGRLP